MIYQDVQVNDCVYEVALKGVAVEEVNEAIRQLPEALREKISSYLELGYELEIKRLGGEDDAIGTFLPLAHGGAKMMLGFDDNGIDPETVVHEFVHYRQFVDGRMRKDHTGRIRWKGEVMADPPANRRASHYVTLPWEREAYWEQYQWAYKNGYSNTRPWVRILMLRITSKIDDLLGM